MQMVPNGDTDGNFVQEKNSRSRPIPLNGFPFQFILLLPLLCSLEWVRCRAALRVIERMSSGRRSWYKCVLIDWLTASRSYGSSRFSERRNMSFDAKRSNKLRCSRFGRFAMAALQQQAPHHHSQNIPVPTTTCTERVAAPLLDYCNAGRLCQMMRFILATSGVAAKGEGWIHS